MEIFLDQTNEGINAGDIIITDQGNYLVISNMPYNPDCPADIEQCIEFIIWDLESCESETYESLETFEKNVSIERIINYSHYRITEL